MRGGAPRRFSEYFRCYPTVMLPGNERKELNYGGKIILPASALEKLTRMHIEYPMMFELVNGLQSKMTHAGVLEFVAEEGKAYLPSWMMKTLQLEVGDLLEIKSTSLKSAQFVKLQPQSSNFLEISDPKAVLEKSFRDFSCVTKGDIFSFEYNNEVYDVAVLEVKPESEKMGVSMLETDVEVDFAPPVGYVEPDYKKGSGTSTPRSTSGRVPSGGMLHSERTLADEINYTAIAPSGTAAAGGARAVSSNFLLGGQKLHSKKGSKAPTPKPSTPVAGTSTNTPAPAPAPPTTVRRTNGPQPLRVPHGQLFFGYEIKPVKTQDQKDKENSEAQQPKFLGQGQTLSGKKRKDDPEVKSEEVVKKPDGSSGRRLDGKPV